ncbi:histidine kinase [Aquimarina sp. MAR_2010_214]|uniref:sensor histidine kinase n=1 Tax=Aquimarina sp. MAR_2010_214 TaxID=1250026 RepID=UPI000C702C2F|nr:histidine kinase [Aquimarina sp. MAR_2010_214]PKV51455.1 histidine kinase [Aquimarina sp. MAR_2010_214]
MLFNKERRIQYLGFNDFWFSVIGVLILSLITDYLFNNSFTKHPFGIAVINWSASLFFTIIDWFIIRSIMIFLRKKYPDFRDDKKRILIFFLTIVSTVLFVDFVGGFLLENILNAFGINSSHTTQLKIILPILLVTIMTMAIYEAVYYYIRLKKSIKEEEQAKQVIVQTQLDALRNQAQPHFLFNSLNTLRDIIDQNSKEDAKEFVDKLSDVYRFILQSGNVNLTSLREELRFAQAYIHIQSERFGNNLKLNWRIPETALDAMIAPMSLQLLLENAIKHNVISKRKPLVIHVEAKDHQLIVQNKIESKSTKIPSTKVGLKNIQKRYALISNKSPEIKNDGNQFIVSLPLLKITDQNKSYASTDY